MIYLKPLFFDSGNFRLYVADELQNRFVILDQGDAYTRWGLERYQLFTHSRKGEPEEIIDSPWVLAQGFGSEFPSGLTNKI